MVFLRKNKPYGILRITILASRDKTGEVYNDLTVLYKTQEYSRKHNKKERWMCLCVCGDRRDYQIDNVISGNSKRCVVCRRNNRIIHGEGVRTVKKSNTYNSWLSLKERCRNPNSVSYHNYGGRGITYNPDWEDYTKFLEDMGQCPEGYSIERVDVNGSYCKPNCKWATRAEQSYNRRKDPRNSSGVEGVSFRKDTGKWTAYIDKEGVRTRGGCFDTKEDAIQKRRELEILLYGEEKTN